MFSFTVEETELKDFSEMTEILNEFLKITELLNCFV